MEQVPKVAPTDGSAVLRQRVHQQFPASCFAVKFRTLANFSHLPPVLLSELLELWPES